MKMLKRSLALMLALIMMISAMPFTAFASESTDVPSEATEAVVDAPAGETTPSEVAEEETVAEETVVETTVAEETVPETTVAEETVPEESVTEETVAEEPVEEVPAVMSLARTTTQSDTFTHKIVHLDNGRKYYTAEWIKALITEMAADGFTQLQLAFGNDGMRFLLDDMSVTVNGTTYSSADVTAGIQAGNKAYYDDGVNELTQAEMDEIIAHAKAKGIEIVPHMNMPGHMDAILDAIEYVGISDAHFTGYTTSVRSLNLNNDTAVAFTKALLEKYVAYFDAKGCSYFHIGADEFANDAYNGSMGFPTMGSTLYTKFATFVNDCAAIVTDAGMTPRAWNDGISYTSYSDSFDTNIEITYWSSGWGGYDVAAASTLRSNGHSMINTNGDYYYILGVNDCYTSGTTTTHAGYDYTAAAGFTNSAFMGSTVSDPIGSMFCIWGDVPGAETETEVAMYIRPILRVMAARMAGSSSYEVDSIVEGGFNADGTINVVETEEPEVETVTKTDDATNISVTAAGLIDLTITAVEEADLPTVEGANAVLAWDITPVTADGNYTGSAEVSVPVPADWTNVRGGVLASANGEEVMGIEGKLENGVFTFTMPHFSTGVVYDAVVTAEDAYNTLVELTVGQTSDTYTDDSGYYTTAQGLDTAVATATLGGNAGSEATVKYTATSVTCRNLLNSNNTYQATDYYVLANDGKYYPLYVSRTSQKQGRTTYYNYTYYYSTDDGVSFETFGTQNNLTDTNTNTNITVYSQSGTEAVDPYTTVSFTGKSAGTTYATVGSTVYKIVVSKAAITDTVTIDTTKTYEDTSATVAVEDSSIATATLNNGTLTITGKAVGTTTVTTDNAVYTITVSEVDLSAVEPLEIEFWITNRPAIPDDQEVQTTTSGDNAARVWIELPATTAGIYSEAGVDLTSLVAPTGVDAHNTTNVVVFWRGVALDTDEHEQTTDANDNESYNGTIFTKIRYWNGLWQLYSSDGWIDVEETTQIAIYYLQKTTVTNLDVIQTEVVDWGEVQGEFSWNWNSENFVALDFAIQYEDGTRNPDSFAVDGKTLVFHCDYENALNSTVFYDSDASSYYRRIGTIRATETSNYEVYMVTVTPNSDNVDSSVASGSGSISTINYSGTEKVIWVDDVANLGKFEDESLQHADFTVGGEPTLEKIDIYNQQAVLVTYYIRAKVTPDSLKVHYIDEAAGNIEFYNYNIAVNKGTYFNTAIALPNDTSKDDPWKGDLVNGTVQTIDPNVTQTVSSDLSTLPAVAAQYLYSEYECVRIELKYTTITNEDGTSSSVPKDLYLYYTFNPTVTFVADFGLPINITATDLNSVLDGIVSDMSVTGGSYTTYGQIVDNGTSITYKPTEVMQGSDFFTVLVTTTEASGILDETATQVAFRVYVVPATTVYYEENFLLSSDASGWTHTAATINNQSTVVLGSTGDNNYGYDSAYANIGTNGGYILGGTGASTSFTFTGTGFQLYGNSNSASGYVTVYSQGSLSKLYMINTQLNGTKNKITGDQQTDADAGATYYSLPFISETDLPYGTYTVQIKQTNNAGDIFLDGVRIINTINDQTDGEDNVYYDDKEDKPDFYQLRDYVLNAIGVEDLTSSQYINSSDRSSLDAAVSEMAGQVYNALGNGTQAVIIDDNTTFEDTDAQDLLDNGPKNELYLYQNQTLAFNVSTKRVMQLGLKAPKGSASFTLTVDGTKQDLSSLSTSVDMFYKLTEKVTATDTPTHTVVITNTGSNVLSVTDLKICDDPNATFVPLTVEDIEAVLTDLCEVPEAETPVEPSKPTEPEVEETTKPTEPAKPTEPSKPTEPEVEETTKPTEPEVEETKPSKPGKPNKEEKPSKPSKPGKDEEKTEKVATLKVTYVSLFGRKVGTATLTKEGNGRCVFTPAEIRAGAPDGCRVLWMIPTMINYGTSASIIVPVI